MAGDLFRKLSGRKETGAAQPEAPDIAGIREAERDQEKITERLLDERSHRGGFGLFFRHPLKVLTAEPLNILILSGPIGLAICLGGLFFAVKTYGMPVIFSTTLVDDFVVWGVLVAVVPVAILDFLEDRRKRSLEEALPNFFRDLAGMNDSGMTLPNAVHLVSSSEYGALTPHIRRLDNDMSWNLPFVEAIYRFGKGIRTPLAERSVDLIAKASKAGGDISEVLRAAAVDTYEFVNLKSERRNNMLIYMVIVLVSFTVFLVVIAILVSTFLTTMAHAGSAAAASGAKGVFSAQIDIFTYKRLFSHAAMIQGFFSGLVAGQMGEGSAIAGLKYSAMMLLVAWVTFRFFI
ncbi:MAG: type II secretion system F family protein [Methanoregulaceae archaeon]